MPLVRMYVIQRARKDWEEWELSAYKEAQKLLRVLRKAGYTPTREILAIAKDPTNWEFWEDLGDAVAMELHVEANWESGRWVLRQWKSGMEAGTGKIIPY